MTAELEPTRREALLADAALGWIDAGDRDEFAALLADPQAQRELDELERAAALASLVGPTAAEDPAADDMLRLAAKLHADAANHFATARAAAAATTRPTHPLRVLPWLLAAASVALLLWSRREPAPLAPSVARAALLRQPQAEWVQWNWRPGPSPRRGNVEGDVVWAVGNDEGYLRLRGLPALDAGQRYQLWVVDGERKGPPVDGGLLVLPDANGEVVVPVRARLPVRSEAAFVLTIEADNGVVVSAQEHVVAIAKP